MAKEIMEAMEEIEVEETMEELEEMVEEKGFLAFVKKPAVKVAAITAAGVAVLLGIGVALAKSGASDEDSVEDSEDIPVVSE